MISTKKIILKAVQNIGTLKTNLTALTNKVNEIHVPTKLSAFENDSGFMVASTVADYITETGTKDGWYYEKYHSGKILIGKRVRVTLGASWTNQYGLYRAVNAISIPFNIPIEGRIEMSGTAQTGGILFFVNANNETSPNQIEVVGLKGSSGNGTWSATLSICIVGSTYTEVE